MGLKTELGGKDVDRYSQAKTAASHCTIPSQELHIRLSCGKPLLRQCETEAASRLVGICLKQCRLDVRKAGTKSVAGGLDSEL